MSNCLIIQDQAARLRFLGCVLISFNISSSLLDSEICRPFENEQVEFCSYCELSREWKKKKPRSYVRIGVAIAMP
jgi:hypothetical protein